MQNEDFLKERTLSLQFLQCAEGECLLLKDIGRSDLFPCVSVPTTDLRHLGRRNTESDTKWPIKL